MLNPSYLIKSRHSIYYFHYPLPIKHNGKTKRISISLGTRCPKQALYLAKALEYHSTELINRLDFALMDYSELMLLSKQYYANILNRRKEDIRKNGTLSKQQITSINNNIQQLNDTIEGGFDDIYELYYLGDKQEDRHTHKSIKSIIDDNNLDFDIGSKEYNQLKSAQKYSLLDNSKEILAYNEKAIDGSLWDNIPHNNGATTHNHKPEYSLSHVIDKYLSETKGTIKPNSYKDKQACLGYITELLGEDYPITKLDGAKARYVKECLIKTPKNRGKLTATKHLPLTKQLNITGMDRFSVATVNKYITYFIALIDWAKNNSYVDKNPFNGMKMKDTKHNKREVLNQRDLDLIFTELDKGKDGLANDDMKYWSTLIFLYTGARRNEIASLTPHDIIQDPASKIWYFNITDEGETKQLKSEAAKRLVPVHSALIERGFLDYVTKVKRMKGKDLRLLYSLTYEDRSGWGRKLTRWFSNNLLEKLEIKSKTKSLHSTRHTVITKLRAARVDNHDVRVIVGHEPDGVTEAIYNHQSTEHLPALKEAIEKLTY